MTNRNIIATASGTVSNGRSTTSNLIYEQGKSSADLVPGHTYTITAVYQENDNYTTSTSVGELEIKKINTTTTITGSNNITIGESVILTIAVKKANTNVSVTRGYITVMDGSSVVQLNYVITGNTTSIVFTPPTAGTHNLRAYFTDDGVEYNSSTSSLFSVVVQKKSSSITSSSPINAYLHQPVTLTGTLSTDGTGLGSSNILLYEFDTLVGTYTTNASGNFSISYSPSTFNQNNGTVTVTLNYLGTEVYNNSSKTVTVNILQKSTTVSLPAKVHTYNNMASGGISALVTSVDTVNTGNVAWLLGTPSSPNSTTVMVPFKIYVYTNMEINDIEPTVVSSSGTVNRGVIDWVLGSEVLPKSTSITAPSTIYVYTNMEVCPVNAEVTSTSTVNKGVIDWVLGDPE